MNSPMLRRIQQRSWKRERPQLKLIPMTNERSKSIHFVAWGIVVGFVMYVLAAICGWL